MVMLQSTNGNCRWLCPNAPFSGPAGGGTALPNRQPGSICGDFREFYQCFSVVFPKFGKFPVIGQARTRAAGGIEESAIGALFVVFGDASAKCIR